MVGERRAGEVEAVDVVVAVALGLSCQAEIWLPDFVVGTGSVHGTRWLLSVTTACMTVPLVWRRRRPLACVLVVMSAAAMQAALTTPTEGLSAIGAVALAVYSVAANAHWRAAVVGGLISFVAQLVVASKVGDLGFLMLIFGAAWAAGLIVHRRSGQVVYLAQRAGELEHERELAAARGATEERQRIARDLHDIVAHRVSLMVVQAQAADALWSADAESSRAAVREIDRAGRAALSELRSLLGVLRDPDELVERVPLPDLDGIADLVAASRAAGLSVDFVCDVGNRDVPPAVGLAAYRIVQEGLTNAAKHARGAATKVVLHVEGESLMVDIIDRGPGPIGVSSPGYGLAGMRERAELLGGSFLSRASPDGGFEVRARLPLQVTS